MSMNAAIKSMFAMWMQSAQTPMVLITAPVKDGCIGDGQSCQGTFNNYINNCMSA